MKKTSKYLLLFMLIFQSNIFSQNIDIDKLNSKINLQEIDYNLINKAVLLYTNKHRNKYRKNKLSYNETLENAALLHSLEMNKYGFFDHINRKNNKFRNLHKRASFVGYSSYTNLAENLYYGFINLQELPTYKDIALEITKAFIKSRSHNKNLLDKNLEEYACALVFKEKAEDIYLYYYFSQVFGSR